MVFRLDVNVNDLFNVIFLCLLIFLFLYTYTYLYLSIFISLYLYLCPFIFNDLFLFSFI